VTAPASLTPELASRFARLALAHVSREYPNKLDHVMRDSADVAAPRALHPVFFGSFDWHSCVHGWWLLATVLRRFPTLPERAAIVALFDERLTAANVAVEVSYLEPAVRAGFERPYGWAWLLMLDAELRRHEGGDAHAAQRWADTLAPLTAVFVERFTSFLPRATYPVRVGTHYNTAFALRLAMEYADGAGDEALAALCRSKALSWYGDDRDCQAWEPSGDDFLSSALTEVECMRAALPSPQFMDWLGHFLPRLAAREPASLFTPATVSDRSDGKIAHLDGLNLSRAWCWRALASSLPADDPRRAIVLAAAAEHLEAGLAHVAGDYAGEHWLATFAVLALGSAVA
jgi:hypothetical protein